LIVYFNSAFIGAYHKYLYHLMQDYLTKENAQSRCQQTAVYGKQTTSWCQSQDQHG